MTRFGLVLLLLSPQASPAEDLLKAVRDRIGRAKTVRIELTLSVDPVAGFSYTTATKILLKGADRWRIESREEIGSPPKVQERTIVSDGRRIVMRGRAEGLELNAEAKPGAIAAGLREGAASGMATDPLFIRKETRSSRRSPPVLSGLRELPRENLGDREARVLEYSVKYDWPEYENQALKVKAWVDAKELRPLQREVSHSGITFTEKIVVFSLDEEIPDSEFSFQSEKGLARARAAQLAESVRLFGLYTGRHPEKLEDLVKRPSGLEAGVFWPARGFVLGGAVPQDPWGKPFELVAKGGRLSVVSRGGGGEVSADVPAVTRGAIGAPSDRLQKHYTARVELQLLAAAVRGYRDATGEMPRKKAALWEKPEWADVWPEGGWLPGGAVPVDPWGDPYRIISDEGIVRVQVKDPKATALGAKALSAEERGKLEEAARPRLTEVERGAVARLLDRLGDDDLDTREQAEGELRSWGSAIAALIEDRLKKEKEGEVALRLAAVRKSIPVRRAGWLSELGPLTVTVRAEDGLAGRGGGDERMAAACLKTLATAQADFRANDRDNNKVNDFWTGDVASLYLLVPEGGKEADAIKLIELSVAAADGAPLEEGAAIEKLAEREPKAGYWFRAMEKDHSLGAPVDYRQETTGKAGAPKLRNTSAFGFCAHPAEYGVTGTRTYILNEGNTIFWKDTGGEPVLDWPGDGDLARGWSKLD